MAKLVVDLLFDEATGEMRVVVDYDDPSLTALDLNEAIREGEVRQEVIGAVRDVFGPALADSVANGDTELVCLDDHPELREGASAQQAGAEQEAGAEQQAEVPSRERQAH